MNNLFEIIEKEQNALIKLDEFEENIKLLNELTKKYDTLKKEIKEEMLKIGKENNLNQIKWETPKGIKITLSIGQKAEFEEVEEEQFNLETLVKEYPEIYEKCFIKRKTNKIIKNASNDRLVITLPKGGKIMNYVVIVGRITKDIELRYTPNNKAYTKFTIAVQKDKEHTNFINCVVWNKVAETMTKYCKKGDLVGVKGEIETGNYENSKGEKVYTTEILASKISFLSTKIEEKTKIQEQQEILNEVVNGEKDIFQEFGESLSDEDLSLPF